MSELLKKLKQHIKSSQIAGYHIVNADLLTDDQLSPASMEPHVVGAEIVDPTSNIDGRPVCVGIYSGFSCFLDGIQRVRTPLYFNSVPVVYGYVSAAVRIRGKDKHLKTYSKKTKEALLFPFTLIDPENMKSSGINAIDTDIDLKYKDHPLAIQDAAKKRVSNLRADLEISLASEWLADNIDGANWLLVDGSLNSDYDRYDYPRVAGLIKTHQTQYFDAENQNKILALKVNERSGVFIPGGRKRSPVYSWYLRLRPNDGKDVYFGLVRVEIAAKEHLLQLVDTISGWILAERSPISLPDARWDRLIYPIRNCEEYLRSLAPSGAVLDASLSGL